MIMKLIIDIPDDEYNENNLVISIKDMRGKEE